MCRASDVVTTFDLWQSSYVASPWSQKFSKMVQPDLDYIAPDVQLQTYKFTTSECDIYSLGLLICTLYNNGRSIVQATHNTAVYAKQIEQVSTR